MADALDSKSGVPCVCVGSSPTSGTIFFSFQRNQSTIENYYSIQAQEHHEV